ncbi:uncharacterized protein LOC104883305 [Beta vulgaris subsp. vulgaris]|uniref:uncharacterized protein LOC104883305 n=1 Tax=Beta vulgaris subsp. vulgaris TaxID=3555 RepID=UPI00053FBF99|nr:uncharacterized protein LOC104883305 [Beta vulgaris subsp. vulgaris]
MDAFSECNQILMHHEDQEKTSFVTNRGIYCYNVMPFGLKNADATYQRLVNAMFKDQLGDTMDVYIDDMLVTSKAACDHVSHLQQAFNVIRRCILEFLRSRTRYSTKVAKRDTVARAIRCDSKATNNEAEYEALLARLTLAQDLKATDVEAYNESLLIVSQIEELTAKDSKMMVYLEAVQSEVRDKEAISFRWRNIMRRFGVPLEKSATTGLSSSVSPHGVSKQNGIYN